MTNILCGDILVIEKSCSFVRMEFAMTLKSAFGKAFVKARKVAGLTQDDYDLVSTRSYISYIERGKNSITIDKLDVLSKFMNIHPASLIIQTYLEYDENLSSMDVMRKIMEDLSKLERHNE